MLGPIERRKVYELVADRILADIEERRMRPGDRLPTERTLAELCRVSRSSIREALRTLQSKGVITSVGHGAFAVAEYVNPLNDSLAMLMTMRAGDLRELFEVRKILEVGVAGLAAARRTESDIRDMRESVEEMVQGLSTRERYTAGDLRFHLSVASAAGNRVASHMMHAIRDVLRRALMSIYVIPGSPERSIEQHRRILEAVVARDPDAARTRMYEHLERVEREIEDVLGGAPDARPARVTTEPVR